MAVIAVNNLVKKYKNITAVDDISFSVKEGTIFGMLGPNGAGKSTTIESIIGIKKRDGGTVNLLGMDPLKDGRKIFSKVGVQLQETSYQDKIKVFELCELFTAMYDEPLDYTDLLRDFDLDHKKSSYLNNLSGGQRQKIAIILALIPNPKVIFLDELTTGLDPKSRREMWDCVKGLKDAGKTIFMTTHYMEEATYLCDTICIIDNGKIIANDTVNNVIEAGNIDVEIHFTLKESFTDIETILKNNIEDINSIEILDDVVTIKSSNEDVLSAIILLLHNKDIKFHKFDIKRPGLEDVYLKFTGKEWKENE